MDVLTETTMYRVVFLDEDHSTLFKIIDNLVYGDKIIPPKNPSKNFTDESEFIFDGWIDQDGKYFNENSIVSKNLVYTAHYLEKTHTYKTEYIVKATCSKDGYKQQKCLQCSHERKKIIPKRLHDWVEVIIKEPTCTETGIKSYKCINERTVYYEQCDEVENEIEIPALGHLCAAANIAKTTSALRRGAAFKCVRDGCNYQYSLYFQNPETVVQTSDEAGRPDEGYKDRDSFINQVFHFGADETAVVNPTVVVETNGERNLQLF